MSTEPKSITLGGAIDQIIDALQRLEADERETALAAVVAHLGIPVQAGRASRILEPSELEPVVPDLPAAVPVSAPAPRDIRSLKEAKSPRTAIEMVCIVAYYLEHLV